MLKFYFTGAKNAALIWFLALILYFKKIETFYPLEGILRLTNVHVHIDSGLQLSEYLYTCYKGIFMPFHIISVLIDMCNELKSMYPPFLLIIILLSK